MKIKIFLILFISALILQFLNLPIIFNSFFAELPIIGDFLTLFDIVKLIRIYHIYGKLTEGNLRTVLVILGNLIVVLAMFSFKIDTNLKLENEQGIKVWIAIITFFVLVNFTFSIVVYRITDKIYTSYIYLKKDYDIEFLTYQIIQKNLRLILKKTKNKNSTFLYSPFDISPQIIYMFQQSRCPNPIYWFYFSRRINYCTNFSICILLQLPKDIIQC